MPALRGTTALGVRARDGLFTPAEVDRLVRTVSAIPLYYLNHSQYKKNAHELYGHWEYPLVVPGPQARDVAGELDALDDSLEPLQTAWRKTRRLLPRDAVTVNAYINGYTHGNDGHPHLETHDPGAHRHHTVLIYCCPRWEPAWGGETVFFDAEGDVSAAALPRPGRVLVFRGDVLHVARAPSRYCPMERRVLVFKSWSGGLPAGRRGR